jgi:hypothetical protein
LCIINFFLQKISKMHTTIRIRYPDIREDLSEKISGYSISDGYQTYYIRIRYPNKISVFVSVIRKKNLDIRKFHPNQCSPSSNPDPDGYFSNHITSLLARASYSVCLFWLFAASGHQKLLRTAKHSAFQSASIKFVWIKNIQNQHKHIIG